MFPRSRTTQSFSLCASASAFSFQFFSVFQAPPASNPRGRRAPARPSALPMVGRASLPPCGLWAPPLLPRPKWPSAQDANPCRDRDMNLRLHFRTAGDRPIPENSASAAPVCHVLRDKLPRHRPPSRRPAVSLSNRLDRKRVIGAHGRQGRVVLLEWMPMTASTTSTNPRRRWGSAEKIQLLRLG